MEGSWQKHIDAGQQSPVIPVAVRAEAASSFKALGFPTPRLEDWKYTNLAEVARTPYALGSAVAASGNDVAALSSLGTLSDAVATVVVVNGVIDYSHSRLDSLPAGLRVYSLRDVETSGSSKDRARIAELCGTLAPVRESAMVALNTASSVDGVAICVDADTVVDLPLAILSLTTGEAGKAIVSYPRLFVYLEKGASVEVLEYFTGNADAEYLTNAVAEFHLEENARALHYRMQQDSTAASHISAVDARIASGCNFETFCFSFGGKIVRNEVRIALMGENAHAAMHGLSVLDGSQHVDNTTLLDHVAPNCTSNEVYKGIYGDTSRGVFSGTIIVRQDAQKTNAIQSNQALLLSRDAEIDSRPQLKIWADDVKCTHGATVGQLDEDALFYLMARGIPKAEARDMLIYGFAEAVIEEVQSETMRALLESALAAKLKRIVSF